MENEMKHFFVKLIPPRADFPNTMSEVEKGIMHEHSIFWRELLERGICIVYGPVFETEFTYGIGIVSFNDEINAKEVLGNDPSVKKGLNRIEIFKMMAIAK